jgi:hypothetical protein
MKLGLLAKDTRTTFKHPGNRVYLLATKNIRVVEKIRDKLIENRPLDRNGNKIKMDILEISRGSCSDEEYFIDESFDFQPEYYYAMFTTRAIPPSHIKVL